MKKNSNSWSLLAMFFAIAVLFAMGPIQGSPIPGNAPEISYAFDLGPPATQTIIPIVSEVIQPILIARGVSVPVKELILDNQDLITFTNTPEFIYNNEYLNQDSLPVIADRCNLLTGKTPLRINSQDIYWQRAREKI